MDPNQPDSRPMTKRAMWGKPKNALKEWRLKYQFLVVLCQISVCKSRWFLVDVKGLDRVKRDGGVVCGDVDLEHSALP